MNGSDYGQGAALLQPIKPDSSSALDECSVRPIACSKKPNHCREVLCANRKGVSGYCWSPQHIWVMAFGKIQHRVYTDHQPFQSILKRDLALAPKCLERILLLLRRYKFTVLYRKGSLLHLADIVSRAPRQDEAVNPSMSDTSSLYRYHSRATTQFHIIVATSTVREELSTVNSILLKSTRAIVPTSLRPSIQSKIHYCHRGAEYCLRFT